MNKDVPTVDEIVRTLKDIVANDLSTRVPVESVRDDASLIDDLKLDSVALVELISAIESRLQFQFDDSDLRLSSFATLRALAQVVGHRLSVAASA